MSRKAALGWSAQSRTLLHQHEKIDFSCHGGFFPPLKKRRFYHPSPTNPSATGSQRRNRTTQGETEHHAGIGNEKAREKLEDREFFLNLLSSASTKREAKSYLSRFKNKPSARSSSQRNVQAPTPASNTDSNSLQRTGVNLGNIFGTYRAVDESPVFRQPSTLQASENIFELPEKLHVAIVKLVEPQLLDDKTLDGVARTLTQLKRLGISCCVVIDVGRIDSTVDWRATTSAEADRLAEAIDRNPGAESRRVDSILSLPFSSSTAASVLSRNLLISPLRRDQIALVIPVGYAQDTQRAVPLTANQAILTLTKEFAGLGMKADPDESVSVTAQKAEDLQKQVAVDRLIILDSAGGVPNLTHRERGAHVFVNLEQEYDNVVEELKQKISAIDDGETSDMQTTKRNPVSPLGKSNPFSRFAEEEIGPLRRESRYSGISMADDSKRELRRHLDNLQLLQQALTLLPPSSSGIITTPGDAANSAKVPETSSSFSAVGTRRRRNPLIHNLLTDKPAHSSSLPAGRLGVKKDTTVPPSDSVTHSTFVKKGMPLTLLPDPRVTVWTPENNDKFPMRLDDPRIDLPRLVHLIEDSFNRELDVQDYMERVNGRLAGLIIAGEYEGGAILTWETPPGVPDDCSPEAASRKVPYLDKFAVLKKSQGAGGVADIVFNAMVRTCFPKGVCWRSRRNNPVNKWYFERSRGTWKLPGTNWTMFWTTDGVPEDERTFWDYEGVCRTIEPSWADKQREAD